MGILEGLDFSKLPPLLQIAFMLGTALVVVLLGLRQANKDIVEPPRSQIDPFQFAIATCDRIERDMHGRFDRLETVLRDIQHDILDVRRRR